MWHVNRNIHNNDHEGCHLDRLGSTSSRVVNLLTSLAALVRPGEVGDGNDEERVAGVGNTGKGVVPGGESSEDTESTTSSEEGDVSVVEVRETQAEEGKVECEEEEEESDSRAQSADEKEEGEDEPALSGD